MEDPLFWDRYEELVRSSTQCLDILKGLGFSWEDHVPEIKRPKPQRLATSQPPKDPEEPIVLSSSSSSDSEDDVPLSLRLKRAKPEANGRSSPGKDAQPSQQTKDDATEAASHKSSPMVHQGSKEQPSEDKGHTESSPAESSSAESSLESQSSESKAEEPASAQPSHRAEPATSAQQIPAWQTSARQAPAHSSIPTSKETIIDLEADKDSDMEFATGPTSPPAKTTSLRNLRRTNPALAKAVQDRSVFLSAACLSSVQGRRKEQGNLSPEGVSYCHLHCHVMLK